MHINRKDVERIGEMAVELGDYFVPDAQMLFHFNSELASELIKIYHKVIAPVKDVLDMAIEKDGGATLILKHKEYGELPASQWLAGSATELDIRKMVRSGDLLVMNGNDFNPGIPMEVDR